MKKQKSIHNPMLMKEKNFLDDGLGRFFSLLLKIDKRKSDSR